MKTELEQKDLEAIADRVAAVLKPVFAALIGKQAEKDCLMNVQELAAYMRVSKQCLYKLTQAKQIPYIKKGNRLLLFRKKEIDKWLDTYNVPMLSSTGKAIRRLK